MQLQIILFLFTWNLPRILMQNVFSKTNDGRKYQAVMDNINDTPSPEWIRYQQERYQHPAIETKAQSELKTNRNFKQKAEETSSARQETNHQPLEIENSEGFKEQPASEKNNENIGNAVEFPSIHGFIEFLKSIKQTWMKNSLLRIDDKIKSLQQLKEALLKAIEKQFMVLWQNDDEDEDEDDEHGIEARQIEPNERNSHLRSKRGILDESSINFPPEAALMSINFLTFSVFLIKLVLQVVNIIRSKHYQVSNINMDMDAIRNG